MCVASGEEESKVRIVITKYDDRFFSTYLLRNKPPCENPSAWNPPRSSGTRARSRQTCATCCDTTPKNEADLSSSSLSASATEWTNVPGARFCRMRVIAPMERGLQHESPMPCQRTMGVDELLSNKVLL